SVNNYGARLTDQFVVHLIELPNYNSHLAHLPKAARPAFEKSSKVLQMTKSSLYAASFFVIILVSGGLFAQRSFTTQLPADRAGVPNWEVDRKFKHDVFTFVRIQYDSFWGGGFGRGGGGYWRTD